MSRETLKDPRVFRVFLSSPFNGIEEERDHLTKLYWPRIKSACQEHRLQFRVVDMRWGITDEATIHSQTINICLRELDRSDFFIGMYGQRYGWHGIDDPKLQSNFDQAAINYPWVDRFRSRSVTEIEFLHGHLNNPGAKPACICFRDKKYDDEQRAIGVRNNDQKHQYKYTSEGPFADSRLEDLRHQVMEATDKALGVLPTYKSPGEAAEYIFDTIWKHLTASVFTDVAPPSDREVALSQHDAFIGRLSDIYIGGDKYSPKLDQFVSGDKSCLLVTGESGGGKSAALANWLHQRNSGREDDVIIYHFIGCASGSSAVRDIISRIIDEMDFLIGDKLKEIQLPEEKEEEEKKTKEDEKKKKDEEEKKKKEAEEEEKKKNEADGKGQDEESKKEDIADNNEKDGEETIKEKEGAECIKIDTANTQNETDIKKVENGDDASHADKPKAECKEESDSKCGRDEKNKDDNDKHNCSMKSDNKGDTTPENKNADNDTKKSEDVEKINTDFKINDEIKTTDNGGTNLENKNEDDNKKDKTDEIETSQDKEKDNNEKEKVKNEEKKKKSETDLVKDWQKMMKKCGYLEKRVIVIIDGLEKIDALTKIAKALYWLPDSLASNVTLMLSTADWDEKHISIIKEVLQSSLEVLHIEELNMEEKRSLCSALLETHSKDLTEAQYELILNDKETANALYLKIIIEELCVFGSYRQLTDKIQELVGTTSVQELFEKVLERLEEDYDKPKGLIKQVLCSICLAWKGLSENELTAMWNIPSNVWSPLYFAIDAYIINRLGLYGIAHQELVDAIKKKYLATEDDYRYIYSQIADYFFEEFERTKFTVNMPERVCHELTYALRRCDDARLQIAIGNLALFQTLYSKDTYQIVDYWNYLDLTQKKLASIYIDSFDQYVCDRYCTNYFDNWEEPKPCTRKLFEGLYEVRYLMDIRKFFEAEEYVIERLLKVLGGTLDGMSDRLRKSYVVSTRMNLATMKCDTEKYEEAEKLHRENLEILSEMSKDEMDEDDQASSYHGIGVVCMQDPNRYDESVEWFEKSMVYYEREKKLLEISRCNTNLGLIAMYKKNYDTAINYFQDVCKFQEDYYLGRDVPEKSYAYVNMAICYRRQKKFDMCEKMNLKALDIKVNSLGWNSQDVALSCMNLGSLEIHRKNLDKSIEWTLKSLAIYENILPEGHSAIFKVNENLAFQLAKGGRHEEGEPHYWKTIRAHQKYGTIGQTLASLQRMWVEYYVKHEDWDKVEEILELVMPTKHCKAQYFPLILKIDSMRPESERKQRPREMTLQYAYEKHPHDRLIIRGMIQHIYAPNQDYEGLLKDTVAYDGRVCGEGDEKDDGRIVYYVVIEALTEDGLHPEWSLKMYEEGVKRYGKLFVDDAEFVKDFPQYERFKKEKEDELKSIRESLLPDDSESTPPTDVTSMSGHDPET